MTNQYGAKGTGASADRLLSLTNFRPQYEEHIHNNGAAKEVRQSSPARGRLAFYLLCNNMFREINQTEFCNAGLERTDNNLRTHSWPLIPMINQKNYYTYSAPLAYLLSYPLTGRAIGNTSSAKTRLWYSDNNRR